jgi:aspartyl-tRNA(Asn)/glutamyl-tRNA(Gln) amidotransferase subunit A
MLSGHQAVLLLSTGTAMQTESLLDLHLFQLAECMRRREVSPVEVTEAALARIEAVEPTLNAFITVMPEQARAAAHTAAHEIAEGCYRGPLHGVPVGVKDLCETAGTRTTAGSRFLANWVPDRDATAVRKLREAGAVVVGKLNMHEFAFGTTGINAHVGTPRNPWNAERVTGGSSSGSGAAVAAGECFAALGSDTGGSIRMPASLCGIVGLKPTHGRVSLHGVVPLAESLDSIGPMGRCVRDVALVLQAIAGHDPEDPWSVDIPVGDYLAHIDAGVQPLRIGVPSSYIFEQCDPDVLIAVEQAIAAFAELGARRVEIDTAELAEWWVATMTVILGEAASVHRERYETDPAAFGMGVRSQLEAGMQLPAYQYVRAAGLRDTLRRGGGDERLFAAADVLVMPATPIVAPRIADLTPEDPVGLLTHNTAPFNLSGHPAISVPCGTTSAGLPIGLQMVGRRWDESTLLRAAAAYERHRGPMGAPRA